MKENKKKRYNCAQQGWNSFPIGSMWGLNDNSQHSHRRLRCSSQGYIKSIFTQCQLTASVCGKGDCLSKNGLKLKISYIRSHTCSGFKEQNTFQLLVIKSHRASCSSNLNILSVTIKHWFKKSISHVCLPLSTDMMWSEAEMEECDELSWKTMAYGAVRNTRRLNIHFLQ